MGFPGSRNGHGLVSRSLEVKEGFQGQNYEMYEGYLWKGELGAARLQGPSRTVTLKGQNRTVAVG